MPKRKPRIIILDTDTELASAYKERLALEGYDCIIYTKPSSALAHIESLGCELIILDDANIAGMSAQDFIDLMSLQSGVSHSPVIILSSNTTYNPIEGVAYYLPKTATDAVAVVEKIRSLV